MPDDLLRWCCDQLSLTTTEPGFEMIAGDASFRRYFRLMCDGRSWIVMDAPPDREDCAPFVAVAARLRRAGIHAPEILAEDLSRGWLLLEDLGDALFRDALPEVGETRLFDQAFEVLVSMANGVDAEGLPAYDEALLQRELDLFPDWYLAVHRKQAFDANEQQYWQQLCRLLLNNAASQPQIFVHRDFHSCNLLYLGEHAPGVIDFQDAVRGPITYDLVSLLLDRYITWPRSRLEAWYEQCRQQMAADVDAATWLRWCDWMGLQRNLKIVGIFARLCYRDGKQHYLELIPRFADYVGDVLARYSEFAAVRPLLEERLCAR